MAFSRRDFLSTAVVGAVSLGLEGEERKKPVADKGEAAAAAGKRPIIISAANGFDYLDEAFSFLQGGGDTLEAALRVVKGPENDPNDDSVGLGGLPNEEGVVELDSCCMHGPTRRAGSVGACAISRMSRKVARAVMEHTGRRDARRRRSRTLCRGPGFSPREPADRTLPQDLVAVEGDRFRLVGAGIVPVPDWHKRLPASPRADDFERPR